VRQAINALLMQLLSCPRDVSLISDYVSIPGIFRDTCSQEKDVNLLELYA